MVLAKRIIPCLDVNQGKVVKGINFLNLKIAGDPVELGKQYSDNGADELIFLDITASPEKREIIKDLVKAIATEIDIPFTVGGGIKSVKNARTVLCNGADKVCINTAAVKKIELVREISDIFGRQCVVVALDVKRNYGENSSKHFIQTETGLCWFEIYTYGGRKATGIDAIEWASKVQEYGAGELLVTSMDRDGTEEGYDIELTRTIAENVTIPVIASGGAGTPEHFLEAFIEGKADAALAASVFHYSQHPIKAVKRFLSTNEVLVRL